MDQAKCFGSNEMLSKISQAPCQPSGWISKLFRHILLSKLGQITDGQLEMLEMGTVHRFGNPSDLKAQIEVLDPRAWEHIVIHGSIGFAECYMAGWVRVDDPVSTVRLFVRNHDALNRLDSGIARLSKAILQVWSATKPNTRERSRKNIRDHYDLGNEFYRLWLDDTMMYSSAIWEHPGQSQAEASNSKIDRICRKLEVGPETQVLEIGTGWGGFALYAAKYFGCHVTTTTISREQFLLANQRVSEAGLSSRITVLEQDYRDLRGQYDRVVSIEMVEAIGWKQFPLFFQTISQLLKPDGAALIQAITIVDRLYDSSRRRVDFIHKHIFPGSCIPSVTSLLKAATVQNDLAVIHLEDIGPHYARTLREWRERFLNRRGEIRALGFSDNFLRMWEWYLAYCEGGYLERQLGDAQILFTKPKWKGGPELGLI